MKKKIDIYKKIYDMADENMKKNNGRLNCSYKMFASRIGVPLDTINIREFDGMTKEEFFIAAYLRCQDRMPDEGAWDLFRQISERPDAAEEKAFQRIILTIISESEEFRKKCKTITGLNDNAAGRKT